MRNVLVIGAGGIGSFLIPLLDKIGMYAITVADPDIVEEKNISYQNFTKEEVDVHKVLAIQKRYDSVLDASKYPILKNVTYESTSKPFTNKELRDILGDDLRKFRAQGLTDRQIRDRAAGRKQFKNLSDEQKLLKEKETK